MTASEPLPETHRPVSAYELRNRWEAVKAAVAECAIASGRAPEEVRILPTTKNQPDEVISVLRALGHNQFAENRAQELRRKAELFGCARHTADVTHSPYSLEATDPGPVPIEWVMIGHLQTNKVREVAGFASACESIDSLRIAKRLDARLETEGSNGFQMPVLVQVNASGEPQKHGFHPDDVPAALEQLAQLPHLAVRGLMAMAPNTQNQLTLAKVFASVRELRDRMAVEWTGRFDLSDLSMGMSMDYPVAIAEGSTEVRLGTVLFGARA